MLKLFIFKSGSNLPKITILFYKCFISSMCEQNNFDFLLSVCLTIIIIIVAKMVHQLKK